MVKIRLRRMGTKGRPFYRIVVTKSTAGRDGAFVEILGSYNPLTQPPIVKLDGQKALQWLLNGAQPTETVAYWLKKLGVLDQYLEQRPNQKRRYKFLDKRTASISVESSVGPVGTVEEAVIEKAPVPQPHPTPEVVLEATVPQPSPELTAEPRPVAVAAEEAKSQL